MSCAVTYKNGKLHCSGCRMDIEAVTITDPVCQDCLGTGAPPGIGQRPLCPACHGLGRVPTKTEPAPPPPRWERPRDPVIGA